MEKKRPAVFYFRVAMATLALLLPLLSLIILGSLWLWQHGFVLYWALAACSITILTYTLERWLFRIDLPETAKSSHPKADDVADPAWSVRETHAWAAVVELANQVRPLEINSQEQIFDLGVRAVETVARSMHPGEDHALWKFTLPEALALVERVSSQLSEFVSENIPLGDRMTVGQFLRVYRWRSAVNVAEQAYDLWRIIRLINPAAAATQEIREQLTRRAYDWGREELAKRLTQAYVREAGRAAIELYSGRMRIAKARAELDAAGGSAAQNGAATFNVGSEPVRILFAGLPHSGKASLIDKLLNGRSAVAENGLAGEYTAIEFVAGDGSTALLIDSPDVGPDSAKPGSFLEAAGQSDLIVWVTPALPHNRMLERRTLDIMRAQAAGRIRRKPHPLICVVTGVEAVGLANGNATNAAVAAAASDLDFTIDDVVSMALRDDDGRSIEAVRQRLTTLMPEAHRGKRLRILEHSNTGVKWGRVWSQVVNAGRSWTGRAK